MDRTKSNKKPIAAAAAVIVLALLLAGTFLWFTAKDEVKNIFDMDLFDVVLVEEFDPNIPVVPGVEIDKKVGVQNKGNSDAAVRVKIEKELQLLEMDTATGNPKIAYNTTTGLGKDEIVVTMSDEQIANLTKSGFKEVTISGAPSGVKVYQRTQAATDNSGDTKNEYFAYMTSNNRVVKYDPSAANKFTYAVYKQGAHKIGIHNGPGDFAHEGISLVMNSQLNTYWALDSNTGYYYYKTLLASGETTKLLLEQVKFAENMGNDMKGAIFVVTPKMEAIQGKDAAAASENWNVKINETDKTVTVGRP